ncbi:hypothetical protein BGW36DRAFT_366513 [Talaromyces proteolyticus]|uniref:Uncharacterized protein n=1 Tax=Talaromyces proteolyticus TaxID=1131652 RepID=A0AAD4L0Q8_9EURO|nr:uncharacterized protein BGW36DRAFT_366513 [Talaromyces proteolyticus]KAH8704954.1 hypothetical protein BGW36DRAFT_366513 [Talaromyces proteolyticus]
MSPASNNTVTSPGKRPALGRRSVSSHAIVSTRTSSANTTTDATESKAPATHKARAHVVGGHRSHGRNPSFGKNLNKLQRLHSTQNAQLLTESSMIGTGARHHQRKKSAPVTPAESPRSSGAHIRWEDTNASLGDHKANTASIRKNYSTPALHRNTSAILGKKSLVTERPHSAKGRPKKSVGFELAGDSDSEAEWEDSTQSPESTRRGSVAPSAKDSAENSQVLVDPLTFVKRPYPQVPQSRSLPESIISTLPQDAEATDDEDSETEQRSSVSSNDQEHHIHTQESDGIANRLLSSSRTSKAPPAMSSISAMGTATAVDAARRNASLTNLSSSHVGSRQAPPTPLTLETQATPQGTSSSIEGGVSRFIENSKARAHATSRTDSDPNTPSSFLPHYHPQTPPSPGHASLKKAKATSPRPRPPGEGPPSRTQQKLWLQRTATLTTSPPDSHGSPALPPSTIDPVFMAASHSRGGQYDNGRGTVNGSVRVGTAHDSEAKHIRKVYEKTASEINVVRRFQNPTKNSFSRIQRLGNEIGRPTSKSGLAGKSVKSAPSLTNGKFLQTPRNKRSRAAHVDADAGAQSNSRPTTAKPGRVYFQEHDDVVNIGDPAEAADRLDVEHQSDNQRPVQHIISTSMNRNSDGDSVDRDSDGYFASEQEMLLRRMWESRGETASPG